MAIVMPAHNSQVSKKLYQKTNPYNAPPSAAVGGRIMTAAVASIKTCPACNKTTRQQKRQGRCAYLTSQWLGAQLDRVV